MLERASPAGRESRARRGTELASLELLIAAARTRSAARLLERYGVTAFSLSQELVRLRGEIPAEACDWYHRLAERPRLDTDGLTIVTAIARAPECQAHWLLAHLGVDISSLRREAARLLAGTTSVRGAANQDDHLGQGPDPSSRDEVDRGLTDLDRVGNSSLQPRQAARANLRDPSPESAREPRARRPEIVVTPRRPEIVRPTPGDDSTPQPSLYSGVTPSPMSGLASATPSPPTVLGPSPLRARSHASMPPPLTAPPPAQTTPERLARKAPRSNSNNNESESESESAARGDSTRASGARRPTHPRAVWPRNDVIARERELAMLCDALLRTTPRPVLCISERGSGRKALIAALAAALDRPLVWVRADEDDDGQRICADLDDLRAHDAIAIMDGIDSLGGDSPPPALTSLLAHLQRHPMPCVLMMDAPGAMRLEAWIPSTRSRFDRIEVEPLGEGQCLEVVGAAAKRLIERHGLRLTVGTSLDEMCRTAQRHLRGMAMPGRALDLLDLACIRAKREGTNIVKEQHWQAIVSERSGLSVERLRGQSDSEALALESTLARSVVGHSAAIHTISELIRRSRAGFGGSRPLATILLLGTSGVGKTELAKALAHALFVREDALVRLDMSEYAESHALARIIGAPPGYVGYEQGGALSEAILQNPHRVVLLDEIEKAHRDVHQLLLQVLDDGRLTDGRGRVLDFRDSVIVMTSNLGARLLESDPEVDAGQVLAIARESFPLELFNRIEAPLVLRPLDVVALREVARRMVVSSSARLKRERGLSISITERAIEALLATLADDPALGARPLRHVLAREVEAKIANAVLRGEALLATTLAVDHDETGFTITPH